MKVYYSLYSRMLDYDALYKGFKKATLFIRQHQRQWVVDMDLSKCFGRLEHERIIRGVRTRVTDGSILKLIQQFLGSGVMVGEHREASEGGSTQGGVISPLLADIYLDAFDQEMNSWRNASSPPASCAMPNKWFEEIGLFSMEHVRTGGFKIT